MQLELTLFTEDSKKEIDSLRENLTLAEEERDNSGAVLETEKEVRDIAMVQVPIT